MHVIAGYCEGFQSFRVLLTPLAYVRVGDAEVGYFGLKVSVHQLIEVPFMRPEVHKLLWRSRRGMLELDTLFQEYLAKNGDSLTNGQLGRFEALLEYQDQELFDAFSGKQALPDSHLNEFFTSMRLNGQP